MTDVDHGQDPDHQGRRASDGAGWFIVGLCFVALSLTFAARSSVGAVMPLWETELGWARTITSSGLSLLLAVMAVIAPLAGNLMDRHGPRFVLAGGLAVLGAAILAMSGLSHQWQFLLMFGVVGGIGYGAVSLPLVSTAVALYFRARRGLATGIAMSGSTGGQLPVLTLLGVLITGFGWRETYLILGLILLLLALAAFVVLRGQAPIVRAGEETHAAELSFTQRVLFLARDRTFLLLFGAFTLCGFTTSGVVDVHLVPYAITCGYTIVDGTAAYGVHGLTNLFGLILISWLADHVHRPMLLASLFFLRALSFILLMQIAHDISLLYAFTAIFGVLNFATFPIVANIVASHIGVRTMGLATGLLFGGHSLGGAVGAVSGGLIYDLLATYDWLWIVSVLFALLASFLAVSVPETRDRTRPPTPVAASL